MSKRARAIEDAVQHAWRLFSAGQTPQAAQVCQQILSAAPGHAEARHLLGLAALRQGQPETADACLADAIARKPGAAALFHAQRGLVLLELGRPAEAEAACRAALGLKPNAVEALQCLGHALFDQRRPEEAVAAYREALRQKPSLADIQNNLAMALREADQPDEAERWFRAAVQREPRDVALRGNLASLLRMEGRLDAAEPIYREALRLDPEDAVQRYNLGILLLLAGRLPEGWAEYEYRFQARATTGRHFPQPLWSGEPLAGRTLLVHAEQGFGDTIQFCRYLPLLAQTGRVVLEAQGRLLRLLSSLPGDIQLVRAGESRPAFDLHCPLLGLPARCGTTLETIPAEVPYLRAEDALVARWRERLGPEGFKVGICWQGNPGYASDRSRSIALEHFRPLAEVPGVRLISLQKTNGVEQLDRLAAELRVETLGDALDGGPDGFVDTAAIMQSLDLVITSDTAIPHLAGALGRPVWMAVAKTPDWRWLLDRPDCPWYPSMRLFRQHTRGDWPGVFAEIASALAALAPSPGVPSHADLSRQRERWVDASPLPLAGEVGEGRPVPCVPVSWGELIDKIAILEIKLARLRATDALANARAEHDALVAALTPLGTFPAELERLRAELATVNTRLWDIEDAIREHEARGDFGASFIALARSVYRENDARGRLKREINTLLGSAIVEEKQYAAY